MHMPLVAIRTGLLGEDGKEQVLYEFLCDWPGCGNIAVHAVGVAMELRATLVACHEHHEMSQRRSGPQHGQAASENPQERS
jgi:hypothetical protein